MDKRILIGIGLLLIVVLVIAGGEVLLTTFSNKYEDITCDKDGKNCEIKGNVCAKEIPIELMCQSVMGKGDKVKSCDGNFYENPVINCYYNSGNYSKILVDWGTNKATVLETTFKPKDEAITQYSTTTYKTYTGKEVSSMTCKEKDAKKC